MKQPAATRLQQEARRYFAHGTAQLQAGQTHQALASFDRAIALDPSYADAYSNCGNLFVRTRQFAEALANYEKAAALAPGNALFASNRGAMLYQLKRYDEALAAYDHALALDPSYLDAGINRASLLADMQRYDEARDGFDAAIARAPESVSAQWNMALLELLRGDFAAGWKRYEWRWRKAPFVQERRDYPQPLWLGEGDITGKTLLIYPEQGFGDVIQFCRYVPLLEARGAKVVLETPAPLVPLMRTLGDTVTIIEQGAPLPPFDLHCPILSLPLAMGTVLETIPDTVPYLSATPEKRAEWAARLGPKTAMRIGLVWSGAAGHVNDHNRSMALKQLLPLLSLPCEFHALQKEVRAQDHAYLGPIHPHGEALRDFLDAAALTEAMDLVICVDTAAVHLAGALGKPCWLLLPYAPDFRWLSAREDSPWYPTLRLFRQTVPGAWKPVVMAVKEALAAMGVRHAPLPPEHQAAVAEAFTQAVTSQQQGATDIAAILYREILLIDARHLATFANLSSLYLGQQKYEEALQVVEQGLAVDDAQPVLYYNQARARMQLKRQAEALESYDRAIALSPQTAVFHSNRGIALFELNRYAEAVESYGRAIALDPANADYYSNRGNALTHAMRIEEALADYAKAVALAPNGGEAEYNRALLQLMQGNFAEGWRRYEARWQRPLAAIDTRVMEKPLWLGDAPIAGKTLLIYPEQGMGDVIQFARYVPLLEAMGAKVVLEVHAPLVGLMQTLSPTASVIARGTPLPAHDLQCPVMSLPLAMGTVPETIPGRVPYLAVSPEKRQLWQQRLGAKTRPRVGLVWSGSTIHRNDHNRSIPLAAFAPVLALPYEFHSLQTELREADRLQMESIITHTDAIRDFADTAALVEAMDVVISVDTSVAHLAGALAKPLWLLVPFIPDFRWLLARGDSPWYTTAELFRQQQPGDWSQPLAQIAAKLEQEFSTE